MPNWAYNRIATQNKEEFSRLAELCMNGDNFDFNRIIQMPELLEKMPATSIAQNIMAIAYYLGGGQAMTMDEVCRKICDKHPRVRFLSNGRGPIGKDTCKDGRPRVDMDIAIADKISDASRDSEELEKEKTYYEQGHQRMPEHYSFDTYEEYGRAALKCLLEYGCFDWYAWSNANWGTKWNACLTELGADGCSVYFETAWSPVPNLIQALSKKLRCAIYMEYAEEQFSAFAGEAIFVNGEVVCEEEYSYNGDDIAGLYKTACRLTDPDESCHRLKSDGTIVYDDDEDLADGEFDSLPATDISSDMFEEFMAADYSDYFGREELPCATE